jgi:hypothetical protein
MAHARLRLGNERGCSVTAIAITAHTHRALDDTTKLAANLSDET